MAVYLVEKKLREDYSESIPQWVLNGLRLTRDRGWGASKFADKGIDMSTAKFVPAEPPRSGRDPFYHDGNKFPVYLLDFNGRTTVYAPGINDNEEVYWDGKYTKLRNLSKKTLLNHTDDFGYIEYDSKKDPRTLQVDRSAAKQGANLDRRKNAQKPRNVYGDKTTKWGTKSYEDDNIIGRKWITEPGYDKSGYKLDPEKYVRQLNSMGLKTYAQKLRKYYTAIKKTQADLAKAISSADIDNKNYKSADGFGRNVMSDVNRASNYLESAIVEYRSIQQRIDRIVNKEGWSDEQKDQYLRDGWGTSGKTLYDYLKRADRAIEAINANESYDD